jgi:hypothetical protein
VRRVGDGIESIEKIAARDPPWFADSRVAAGKKNWTEAGETVETEIIRGEEFSAPDGGVGAEARAIPGDADDAALEAVLGHAAGDVGVMMLDVNLPQVSAPERVLGAQVAGMQIVRDGGGGDVEEARHALQGLFEEAEGLEVFEVAEVLAGNGETSSGEAEGVLLLSAAGEDFGFAAAEEDGHRCIAASAADGHDLAGDDADDGVVDASMDAAIVVDERIGDRGEALFGFGVIDDDGLFADVAAGHDERGLGIPAFAQDAEEEIVHRRTGKHHAGCGIAGRHRFGEVGFRTTAKEDDGALAADEGGALFR